MIEAEVGFETQFRYWLIDAIAGTIELERLHDLIKLPELYLLNWMDFWESKCKTSSQHTAST